MHLISRLPSLVAAIVLACAPAMTLLVASTPASAQAPATEPAKPADAAPAPAKAPPPPEGLTVEGCALV